MRPTGRHPPASIFVMIALVGVALPVTAEAQDRVVRTFGQEHGLAAAPVWDLAQDSTGFIWVGAEGGLFRFDGTEIRQWAGGVIAHTVLDVAVSPSGRVVALDGLGHMFEVSGRSARELELPWKRLDSPRRSGRMVAFDADDRLWVRYGDAVGVQDGGRWRTLDPRSLGGEVPRGLEGAGRSGAYVSTAEGLWRVTSDLRTDRLFTVEVGAAEAIAGVVESGPDRLLILLNVGREQRPRVVEIVRGETRPVEVAGGLPESRAIAIQERHGTIWLALDRFLAALRPGERLELLGPEEGFESGGPLLFDREGSLWLGSFVGLHQYPEPDTRMWAERQGIPSRHTRYVARTGSTLWTLTWNGPGTLRRSEDGWFAAPEPWDSRSNVCPASDGSAWTANSETIVQLVGDSAMIWPGLGAPVHGCTGAPDGTLWFGTPQGLIRLDPIERTTRTFNHPRADQTLDPRPALLHDRHGRLWVGAGRSICAVEVERLEAGGTAPWRCEDVASTNGIFSVIELEDGRLWASAGPVGLLEFDGKQWRPVVIEGAPTQTVNALVPSPRGGTWVAGEGILARVRSRPGGTLEVLERLSMWHGLSASAAGHLVEEPEGDLWLATSYGVVQVPAHVRFGTPSIPSVALVEGFVDDRPVRLDEPLVLSHDRNRIELRFAALSFRDRAGLRHQVRLSPDEPWSETAGNSSFRWVDLSPGTYHAQYRASRDGRAWSPVPAGFTFRVLPPWYTSPWFLALAGLIVLATLALIYRGRVRYLLDLEQQRTRIAMDLHDQVGSGLASVGILSGVMAAESPGSSEQRETAEEIAGLAEELGYALSDIVWALDPHTTGMEELGNRLAEHGQRLFPGDQVRFESRLPSLWPESRSSLALRRSVLLIGLEALHNAARHSGARQVTLSLASGPDGSWDLSVSDDGRGLRPDFQVVRGSGGGRGISGMARRAEAIGARLRIRSRPESGTTISLRFHPDDRALATLLRRCMSTGRSVARMIMLRRIPS